MDAQLTVLSGPLSGQTVRIPRKLLIGRAADCDLRIESDCVSTYHCVLLVDEYTLRLRDLGSRNGTLVNGHQVGASAIILLHDDLLSLGDVKLLVDLTPETAPTGSQPLSETCSTLFDGTVLADGDLVPVDDAEIISPPTLSIPDQPLVFPPTADVVPLPERQAGGHG
jgi:pSer/pThr/pTyr-binding forkhead associated (FHA) protein